MRQFNHFRIIELDEIRLLLREVTGCGEFSVTMFTPLSCTVRASIGKLALKIIYRVWELHWKELCGELACYYHQLYRHAFGLASCNRECQTINGLNTAQFTCQIAWNSGMLVAMLIPLQTRNLMDENIWMLSKSTKTIKTYWQSLTKDSWFYFSAYKNTGAIRYETCWKRLTSALAQPNT